MKTILIIDDDDAIRLGFMDLLQRHNFSAIGALEGRQGIDLARKHIPDLILCDIMMPQLDGFQVLQALRKDPLTASIPFIFLTGKSDHSDLRTGMESGAYDYLTKPCSGEEMLRAVNANLDKHATAVQQYKIQIQKVEEKLDYLSTHDQVTGLGNLQKLRTDFEKASAGSDSKLAVLVLKPNRYQKVCEFLGPHRAEELWKAVVAKLIAVIDGPQFAARLPEGQFVILLLKWTDKEEVTDRATRIQKALARLYHVDEDELFLTFSAGISLEGLHGKDLDSLLPKAQGAAEVAIKNGLPTVLFDDSLMSSGSFALEQRLRHALDRKELFLNYQPQVHLKTGLITGMEALIRWRDPVQGIISPGVFIPLAEESELIVEIGTWVMQTACVQAASWNRELGSSLRIAVNLAERQFRNPHLCDTVRQILSETGLEPGLLELEIVESTIMDDAEMAAKRLDELKSIGVLIAMDDFGTGYSSLAYLRKFPFDIVKIDKSLIHNIARDPKTAAIGKAIIQMTIALGLDLIAEGVETEAELEFLRNESCNQVQGFLISRPMMPQDFPQFYRDFRMH